METIIIKDSNSIINGDNKIVASNQQDGTYQLYYNHRTIDQQSYADIQEEITMASYVNVNSPLAYDRAVSAVVTDAFSYDAREAAISNGVHNGASDSDFVKFQQFREYAKNLFSFLK